jgi:hypothetical protein
MKTKLFTTLLLAVLSALLLSTSCKKDEDLDPVAPPAQNAGEVITTIKLTFTDSANASNVFNATFNDPDGDGGNGPTQFDTITLAPNKTYFVSILLLDITKSPVDTISNEVLEEANDHMFFFHHTGVGVNTIYLDQDTNNPPLGIGLSTKWKTDGTLTNGTSQIILKHQPGSKNGTETPGDTDVDVTFQCKIQ